MKRTEYLRTTPVVQGVRYLGDGGFQPGEVIGGPSVRFSPDGFNCFQDLIIVKRFNRRRGLDPRLPLLDLKPYTCIRYPVSKRSPIRFQLDVEDSANVRTSRVRLKRCNSLAWDSTCSQQKYHWHWLLRWLFCICCRD